MRVSVVTISYNQAEYLERALLSVLDQDYDDMEYIVVDPGSTDGSRDIIERYRPQLAKVILERDDGPPDGLNKGFAMASGEVFAYVNADDALLPSAIREAVEVFQRYPSTDVAYGHGYIVDASGRVVRRFRSTPFNAWRFVHRGAVVMQQATFFRRGAFLDVGGFNSRAEVFWDGELLLELGIRGKTMRRVNRYWGVFTLHDDSLTAREWAGSDRLQAAAKAATDRLFERVMGRTPAPRDRWGFAVARIQKWLIDPVGVYWRLVDLTRLRSRVLSRGGGGLTVEAANTG